MEFSEVKRSPQFTLDLTLEEAISLWRVVDESYREGNENAKQFVDALYEFAKDSNYYTKYLE